MRNLTVTIGDTPVSFKKQKSVEGKTIITATIRNCKVDFSVLGQEVTLVKGEVAPDLLPGIKKMIGNYYGAWVQDAEKKAFPPAWNTPAVRDVIIEKEISKNLAKQECSE